MLLVKYLMDAYAHDNLHCVDISQFIKYESQMANHTKLIYLFMLKKGPTGTG